MKRLAIFGAAVTMLASGEALAQTPSYVGKWASNPVQCLLDQSVMGAPMILASKRYDQHEAHCIFTSVKKTGKASWQVRSRCTVEGSRAANNFTLAVDGNNLTMREAGGGARTLIRCL